MARTPYDDLPPAGKAQSDFMEGGGVDDNPYPVDTPERLDYALKMSECWSRELTDLRNEMGL